MRCFCKSTKTSIGASIGGAFVILMGAYITTKNRDTSDDAAGDTRSVEASGTSSWRNDPAWYQGKAEFALYDASRTIYDKPRSYEARIFTNKQHMDPGTTTKASDWNAAGMIEVFKHNVSEMVPTQNYTYRFLTTSFIRTDSLEPYKLAVSTQEDCGSTYKQLLFEGGDGGTLQYDAFSYFPDTGKMASTSSIPGQASNFHFYDDLMLVLRDFNFASPASSETQLKLLPEQTNTKPSSTDISEAQVHYEGRETVSVPYGTLDAHHLRVTHAPMGGVSESHYWFAADESLRHVLVQYEGPFGVSYKLKKLAWWAYWDRSIPEPE